MQPAIEKLESMARGFVAQLPNIIIALIVFLLFYFVAKLIRHTVRAFVARQSRHRNVGLVMGRLTQGVVVFVGLTVALVIALPTFTPGRLIEMLGFVSIAAGFAFRDILQNFLGGILLLWTEPFHIGDQIIVGTFEGTVEDIQTRATFIRTYDNRRIVIPNAKLFTESVTVNTAFEKRRLEYDLEIGYGDNIPLTRRLVLEALGEVETALADPAPEVLVQALAPAGVVLRVRWWIHPPRRHDALDARDQVIEAIKSRLLEHGVDVPFPTQVVLFHDQTEETDGDRSRQREGWPAGPGPVPRPARERQREAQQQTPQNKREERGGGDGKNQ